MSWTKRPCEGCGQGGYRREAGTLCRDCLLLMDDGRRLRAEKAAKKGVVTVIVTPDIPHWNPRLFLPRFAHDVRETQDELNASFYGLIGLLLDPIAGGDGMPRRRLPKGDRNASHDGAYRRESWHFVRVDVADAIDRLFMATNAALVEAERQGRMHGSSLIRRLASGDLSPFDYEKASSR